MLNQRITAARQVNDALTPAEEAAEASFLGFLKLGVAMCEARSHAKLPIHTAEEEFSEIANAIFHAAQARASVLRAHRQLAVTRDHILPGVPARMYGDNCPVSSAEEAPQLRSVG